MTKSSSPTENAKYALDIAIKALETCKDNVKLAMTAFPVPEPGITLAGHSNMVNLGHTIDNQLRDIQTCRQAYEPLPMPVLPVHP
jgi:hypothetical protein